jgi:hypothetical protein
LRFSALRILVSLINPAFGEHGIDGASLESKPPNRARPRDHVRDAVRLMHWIERFIGFPPVLSGRAWADEVRNNLLRNYI